MNTKNIVKLINKYLAKQTKRLKCGHKKGDLNHLEAA